MPHFNQQKIERKNCVWKTKFERLLEMCVVQHVEMESVFICQPMKWLVSTTIKSAKPAATFWIFLVRIKNRQLYCLAVTVHIASQKRRVATTKKDSHNQFWRKSPANHNQAHPNLKQKRQKLFNLWHNRVHTHWLIQLSKTSNTISFYALSVYNKAWWFCQTRMTVLCGLSPLHQIQWLWV